MDRNKNACNRLQKIKGRGTSLNPANRFEPLVFEQDEEYESEQDRILTQYLVDDTLNILSKNTSEDIPFMYSLNPYRGCEHGCVYCYARPSHEYLGFSSGVDFESTIVVKHNAAELLEKAFQKKSWKPQPIVMSGITDPYQPIERKLEITRKCLKVFLKYRNPVSIITKNHLVTRDIDILKELASLNLVRVLVSVTSLEPSLTATLEPRTSRPSKRLEAIKKLTSAGVETGIMTAPVIPGINDHELPALLESAAGVGAKHAGYVMLRLPWSVKELFINWLEHHFPDRKEKVLNKILDIRDGKLNDSEFGSRMKGNGKLAEQIKRLFEIHCKKNGLNGTKEPLNTNAFIRNNQMSMFI